MNLETRLDKHIAKHPREFSKATVERVREFVRYEYENPEYRKPYRLFETIDDFILYKNLRPEWKEYSTKDMQEDMKSGASAFYATLLTWVRKRTDDQVAQKDLMQRLFPARLKDYSSFETIDDWFAEFKKHREWRNYNTKDMQKDAKSGASSFYWGFLRWVRKQTDKLVERRTFVKRLFPARLKEHLSLETIDDWIAEFKKHREWRNYNTNNMVLDKASGASAFYQAFLRWVCKQTEDQVAQKDLMQRLFPAKYNNYSFLNTINDWVAEFKKHREWRNYNTKDMQNEKEFGGNKFYQAFGKWTRAQTDDPTKRRKLVLRLFPERLAPFPYSTGKEIVYFGSRPERVIGLLLNQYGLLKKFKEGKNVHVRTNGHRTHNLDFCIDKIFLEFHPLSIGEKKKGLTLCQVEQKRREHITNPAFNNHNFYFITDVRQVYDFLHVPEVRRLIDRKMKPLSYKQFTEELSHAYARANSYDNKHPELFK